MIWISLFIFSQKTLCYLISLYYLTRGLMLSYNFMLTYKRTLCYLMRLCYITEGPHVTFCYLIRSYAIFPADLLLWLEDNYLHRILLRLLAVLACNNLHSCRLLMSTSKDIPLTFSDAIYVSLCMHTCKIEYVSLFLWKKLTRLSARTNWNPLMPIIEGCQWQGIINVFEILSTSI